MDYKSTKAYKKILGSSRLIETAMGPVGNRSWFMLNYAEKNSSTRSLATLGDTFQGIDEIMRIGKSIFHKTSDFPIYEDNVNSIFDNAKRAKQRPNSASYKADLEKLQELYNVLCGRLGGYQSQISKLSQRVTDLEEQLTTPETSGKSKFWNGVGLR